MENHEAVLNITWAGQNGELGDPVDFDAADGDIFQWAAEAVRAGNVPGIETDPNVNFTDFVVDRFARSEVRDNSVIYLRPKTPFGEKVGCRR